jgi:SMI1-KNR4 cell-wall
MAKAVWSQLPQRLKLLVRDGETLSRPSPAELDAALDDYEARVGFRLPVSYREFMHWFGPGALSEWFQFCGPIPARFRGQVADVYDIDKQREMLEEPEGYWASSVSPEVLRQLVLFASTEGGDWFFWDTADVRSKAGREYGIYGHAHSNSGGKVELIAPSFKALVTEVALGERYPFSDEEREPEWSFESAWPSKRRKRGKTVEQ